MGTFSFQRYGARDSTTSKQNDKTMAAFNYMKYGTMDVCALFDTSVFCTKYINPARIVTQFMKS